MQIKLNFKYLMIFEKNQLLKNVLFDDFVFKKIYETVIEPNTFANTLNTFLFINF